MPKDNPTPDDMPDEIQKRMPDPKQPAVGIEPAEAMRYLAGLAEASALASIVIAAACHALENHADDEPDERTEHMRAIAKMLSLAGKLACKAGSEADGARDGMRKAFAAIGIKLDGTRLDPEAVAGRLDGGQDLHKAVKTCLDAKNGLAAGILCRADHPGARDLADRSGLDPDALAKDGARTILDPKTGTIKPADAPQLDKPKRKPKAEKPADTPPAKPTPPTWTGRNGTKWNPDGTMGTGDAPKN